MFKMPELRQNDIILTQEVKEVPLGSLGNKKLFQKSIFGMSEEDEAIVRDALYGHQELTTLKKLYPDGMIGEKKFDLSAKIWISIRYSMVWYVKEIHEDYAVLVAIGQNETMRTADLESYREKYDPSKLPTLEEYMTVEARASFFVNKAVLRLC